MNIRMRISVLTVSLRIYMVLINTIVSLYQHCQSPNITQYMKIHAHNTVSFKH